MNVSTDACILINLLRVHRLDLLGAVPPYLFCVPKEALKEITYPDQQAELKEALDRGWIQETRLEAIIELQIFTRANVRIPVKWATDSGDVGQGRSEATLVVFLQ
jgi:hypothetical protein